VTDLLHEVFYRLRPFGRVVTSEALYSELFVLLGESKFPVALCFFPVEEFKGGIVGVGGDSSVEFLEAASDAFDDLFVFKFEILMGFLEQFVVGGVLEVGELVVLEGGDVRLARRCVDGVVSDV